MSSIQTNSSSLIALQTLKSINSSLSQTQNEISTGKKISTAKDNSAVWAISKVMESDVSGFKAISESLSLGASTVAVARQAAESVTKLLTDIKASIVTAQGSNVDRAKIQTNITNLTEQIGSVVKTAQFNGLNLVSGFKSVDVLSSLNRASDGTVTAANITVQRQDLSSDAGVYGTGASLSANVTASGTAATNTAITQTLTVAGTIVAGEQFNFQIGGTTVSFVAQTGSTASANIAAGLTTAINAAGITDVTASITGSVVSVNSTSAFSKVNLTASTGSTAGTLTLSATSVAARAETLTFSNTAAVNKGDGYRVALGGVNYDYVAGNNESAKDIANGLKAVIDGAAVKDVSTSVKKDASTGNYVLMIDNNGSTSKSLSASGAAGGTATGGLFALKGINVTTAAGAKAALQNIETLIQTSIDGAASFGSSEKRIGIQNTFVGKLTDSLKLGIGAMVDANMEEASARLQALQVQQQLGVQSLSMANKAPQSILRLFR
ncbi:MAG: flagellin [Alphaproteobacteria bacterium]|nr:flagellin [Alphaproteobacteria bacterium]